MIVDSSAALAILFPEPGYEVFREAILGAERARMSVANWLETALVVEGTRRVELTYRFDQFAPRFGIELVDVDRDQIECARRAASTFGRGHHPARLNFGDCFAYALSKVRGEPLLFKGNDFPLTDIVPALPA